MRKRQTFKIKPKVLKTAVTRKSFTTACYAVIGTLVDDPKAVFSLTTQRVAERMVKHGWLKKRTIKLPQKVGVYEFEADFVNFTPTEEGLRLFNDINRLVKGVNVDKLKFAIQGEAEKQQLVNQVEKLKLKMSE
jgi:hypothetical protein